MNQSASNTLNQPVFSEKLLPTAWGFVAIAILWPSVALVFLPINAELGFWLGPILTIGIWAAMYFASPKIIVESGQLHVGRAHIPVEFISGATVIAETDAFAERGPKLDARAFVRFQMGVKTLVKVAIIDPVDPTPYWLISTRKPQQLAEALGS